MQSDLDLADSLWYHYQRLYARYVSATRESAAHAGASGITSASTSTDIIANQPSFYLPDRTRVDANVTYRRGAFTYQLAVSNLFDELDYAASQTRFLVYVGNPRAVTGSVAWKF